MTRRPWNEDWRIDEEGDVMLFEDGEAVDLVAEVAGPGAALISAAPEMARALLKLFNECATLDKYERRTITDALVKAGVPVEEKC